MEPVRFAPKKSVKSGRGAFVRNALAPENEAEEQRDDPVKPDGEQPSEKTRMASKADLSMRAVRWGESTPTHVWMRALRKVREV